MNIRRFFRLSIVLAFPLSFMFLFIKPVQAVQVGSHEVNFITARYNFPSAGQSTWYYEIKSGGSRAIGNVLFEANLDCISVAQAGSWDGLNKDNLRLNGGNPSFGASGPSSDISGVRFEKSFKDYETRYYYITFNGNYGYDPSTKVVIKSGILKQQGTIIGASRDCQLTSPSVDIQTMVNDEPSNIRNVPIPIGEALTLKYIITNTGNVPLESLQVQDDQLGDICGVEQLEDGQLDLGEVITCQKNSIAYAGLHTHIGTATAYFHYRDLPVSDSDPATYSGYDTVPQITLEVKANGASTRHPGPFVPVDEYISFDLYVTNIGESAVDGFSVYSVDARQGCLNPAKLDPGQTGMCEISAPAFYGSQYYTFKATSHDFDDDEDKAQVDAFYVGTVSGPSFQYMATVNGADADFDSFLQDVLIATYGSTVSLDHVIYNTGDVELTVSLRDNLTGHTVVANVPVGAVQKEAIWSGPVGAGLHNIIGSVTTTINGHELTVEDNASYFGLGLNSIGNNPFDVEVYANGDFPNNADFPPGEKVSAGTSVYFTVEIKNGGGFALKNITVQTPAGAVNIANLPAYRIITTGFVVNSAELGTHLVPVIVTAQNDDFFVEDYEVMDQTYYTGY